MNKTIFKLLVITLVISICLACLIVPASAGSVDIVFPFAEPDIWFAFTGSSNGATIVIVDICSTGTYRVVVNSGSISVAADSIMDETTVDVYWGTFNSAYPPILRQLNPYKESDYSYSYAIPGLSSQTETSYYGFACHNDFATLDFQKIRVGDPFNVITPIFGNANYKTYLEAINQGIATSNSWLSKIWTSITDGFDSVGQWFSNLQQAVTSSISNVSTWISNQTTSLSSAITSGVDSITAKLDELIDGAAAAGDKIKNDAADLSQTGSDLKNDIGKLDDFDDQQFGVLDQNFGSITSGGDLTNLFTPLSHVLVLTNHVVEAVPSNYRSYWTVPFFFGIFFLICQHIKGPVNTGHAVDYDSKPKKIIGFGRDLYT